MLKLIEVWGVPANEASPLLASLDVTANAESERQDILQSLKDIYGVDCKYTWHDCGHDEEKPCISRDA